MFTYSLFCLGFLQKSGNARIKNELIYDMNRFIFDFMMSTSFLTLNWIYFGRSSLISRTKAIRNYFSNAISNNCFMKLEIRHAI